MSITIDTAETFAAKAWAFAKGNTLGLLIGLVVGGVLF